MSLKQTNNRGDEQMNPVQSADLPQKVHVPVCSWVLCEDVMVRYEDDLLVIPHLSIHSKLSPKDAKGRWPAHIMSHQLVHICPNVLARGNLLVV